MLTLVAKYCFDASVEFRMIQKALDSSHFGSFYLRSLLDLIFKIPFMKVDAFVAHESGRSSFQQVQGWGYL